MSDETLSLDDLSAELDKCVLEAQKFIGRFKDLAARLDLPDADDSRQTLEATESLIFSYRDIARRVAQDVKEASPEGEAVLLALIVWATRQIRRATLMLKQQVFRLENILGTETESLSIS